MSRVEHAAGAETRYSVEDGGARESLLSQPLEERDRKRTVPADSTASAAEIISIGLDSRIDSGV